ncbi:PAS domain-containing sensor histidine kinase [Granulicella arctica]|uniref:PAS domain-containing sensor histidine kinase n=1 Tax=Granulicella arctica TaxID=940613 RepID=UPI0021DF51CC|nr:PAS domain-containing sensor histidine kinase [Granulicella arctica]
MSLVVRIIAPTGRDAELINQALQQNGLAAEICTDFEEIERHMEHEPIGPLLVAEEALTPSLVEKLSRVIEGQPSWSDLPVLILTGSFRQASPSQHIEYEKLPLGSPILLERPIRTATLVSSLRAALRARQRQYEIRDTLYERDHALADLQEQRETLQAVLDHLPVGVILAKPDGEIIFGNRSLERITRHPVIDTPDMESHGKWAAFHADGSRVKALEFPLPRAMEAGHPIPPEDYLYERGDGTLAWISLAAAPILNEEGIVTGGVVALSDIDRQKRADADLRRSDERFRRLIEKAIVGVIIGNLEGSISYANPAILKLLGYTEQEVHAGLLRWDLITPPEFAEADRHAVEQLKATGAADSYQKQYRAKDGRLVPVLVGAIVIPSPTSAAGFDEVAVFLTDLSSQKQAETALIQSEKLAVVGRLAASISHEINNPLESVTNLLYIARQEETPLPDIHRFLDMADEELRRVSQIVAQTLRFHRQSTRPRAITPEALLSPALGLYQGRLANSHITLHLQHRLASPVTCYEGDIRQVLNNLIGNAIDSMRTGGRLIVRTSNSRCWRTYEPGVRITIADTGHGMSSQTRQRIFEAFYTTKGMNGTGLGLWISFGIVEKHHGRLQVFSSTREGRSGTVFSLFLPTQSATPDSESTISLAAAVAPASIGTSNM